MNILVIGKFYTEGFALHIAETLEMMGNDVARFEPGVRSGRFGGALGHRIDQVRGVIYTATDGLPRIRAHHMHKLWQVVEQEPLDIIIVCHDFLWPAEVRKIKQRTKALVAMWFPDSMVNFRRGYFMNAPYDGLFFKDPYIKHILKDVLVSPVYYLPECFNPEKHKLLGKRESISDDFCCDITTAGGQHSWRVAIFEHLAGRKVKLWGPPGPLWMSSSQVASMYQKRGVYNHDKASAFLGAKIVLNTLLYGEVWGLNVRAFEIAGIGGFQLIDWRPGLQHLFRDGEELVSFTDMDDLKVKIDFYLDNPSERKRISENGQVRALAEHTYQHRLTLLIDTLAGKANGVPVPNINCVEEA